MSPLRDCGPDRVDGRTGLLKRHRNYCCFRLFVAADVVAVFLWLLLFFVVAIVVAVAVAVFVVAGCCWFSFGVVPVCVNINTGLSTWRVVVNGIIITVVHKYEGKQIEYGTLYAKRTVAGRG